MRRPLADRDADDEMLRWRRALAARTGRGQNPDMIPARNRFLAAFLGCSLSAMSAAAQSTWIVDASNGPGAHFTSLQTAISTAAPGDRLLVRAGNYLPAVMDRGLTIVGEGADRVFVVGSGGYSPGFLIQSLPAGSYAAIEGITFAATALVNISLAIQNCQGRVILDRVHIVERTSLFGAGDVRFTRCELRKGLVAAAATAALDRCLIDADPFSQFGLPGVGATSSFLHLDRCHVQGSDRTTVGSTVYADTVAVELTASTVVLSGDGTGVIAAGNGGALPAVRGSGTLVIDPHVVLQPTGSSAPTSGVVVVTRARPSLAVDAGPPGGTVDIDLFGAVGSGYATAVGVAIPPADVPALGGRLWMDTVLVWNFGVFGPTGRVSGQVPLPNLPAITGITFTWQAVEFGTTIALANQVSYVHPW